MHSLILLASKFEENSNLGNIIIIFLTQLPIACPLTYKNIILCSIYMWLAINVPLRKVINKDNMNILKTKNGWMRKQQYQKR